MGKSLYSVTKRDNMRKRRVMITFSSQISETQHDELQAVRHHISKCFDKVGCFLLPHPGKKVAGSPNFKGELQGRI